MLVGEKSLAQSSDSLDIINTSISEKRFGEASNLLEGYCHKHPKDFNAFWLYAQIEYWQKNYSHSRKLYQAAMSLEPTNAYLQLDYARMLANTAHYHAAQKILLVLKTYDVTRDAATYELAKSYYWQKNNTLAKREAKILLQIAPTQESKKLSNDISFAAALWMKASSSFTSDTQPLTTISPSFEMGISVHRFFSPYAGYYQPTFTYRGNTFWAPWFVVGNQFSFGAGPEIKVEIGTVQVPYKLTQLTTRKIGVKQKLGKYMSLDFLSEHKPYFNTLKSIDTVVTVNHISSSIDLYKPDGVIGKIGFDNNRFADGNNVYSFFAYLLLNPIKIGGSQFRLGYAFTFNDSKQNRFVTKDSFSEVLAKGPPIAGVYDPYFTPQQQVINSVVASWLIPFSKSVKMGVNANVAFYATTLNPYFYIQKRSPNTYTLHKDYADLRYTPWDISTYLQCQLSSNWTVRADYQYKSTFFFQSNYVGLSINTVLFHERK